MGFKDAIRAVIVVVTMTGTLAACAYEELIRPPQCTGDGSGIILTQSVASATLVPCLEPLPTGWEVASVEINQNGSKLVLDSDRAGYGAAELRFMPSCENVKAFPIQGDHNDARRFGRILRLEPSYRAEHTYVFEGGCVTWKFDFDTGVSPLLATEVEQSLILLSRETVNQIVRESFIDRRV